MATGDILACRIASATRHNGWVGEIDIDNLATGGTYDFGLSASYNDPVAAKIKFTLTSLGYDDVDGTATTRTRTIYGCYWVRQPYPNQTLADESVVSTTLTVRVALSDFIYDPDVSVTVDIASGFYTKTGVPNNATAGLSVTNNSTLAYPTSVGRWAKPQFEKVGTSFVLEACIFNRFVQSQKPLAAVKFVVTDEHSHTVTVWSKAMTVSQWGGDYNAVIVYAATIDTATLDQGDVLTCNFTAYPWIGDSGSILTSANAITPPDERLSPLLLLCDKAGTYGGGWACVHSSGLATTATTYVFSTQALAESDFNGNNAHSYNNIGRAVQAIKSWNNTNLSRNEPGGGGILLTQNNHDWPGTVPADQGAQETWITITRLSTLTRKQCVISTGSNAGGMGARRVKVLDVSLIGTSTGQIMGEGTLDMIWIDQCTINMTGVAAIYTFKQANYTRNTVAACYVGFTGFSTTKCPPGLIRSNVGPVNGGSTMAANAYCCLGNKNLAIGLVGTGAVDGAQTSEGAVIAYNSTYRLDIGWGTIGSNGDATVIAQGLAYIQNLVEKITTIDPICQIFADSCASASSNIIFWHNTLVGERMNIGYNDTGSGFFLHKNYSLRNNIIDAINTKDDTFPTGNAARTGGWPMGYNVGNWGNYKRMTNSDPEWFGEFKGLYTITAGTLGFIANRAYNYLSGGGDATGNGDYHLQEVSTATGFALPLPELSVLPFDLAGTKRRSIGGAVGAYEFVFDTIYRRMAPTQRM